MPPARVRLEPDDVRRGAGQARSRRARPRPWRQAAIAPHGRHSRRTVIAGGILGSTIGHGTGRAAATALGVLGGAAVGNHVEVAGSGDATPLGPHCHTETAYENRTVAYDVSYEWGGRTYTAQMPYDPGQTVALQVSPVGAAAVSGVPQAGAPAPAQGIPILRSYEIWPGPAAAVAATTHGGDVPMDYPAPNAYPAPVAYPAPMYPVAPVPLYHAVPVYPVHAVRPYHPPAGLSLHFGYSRGFGRHHRGHGRWR